ncbi:MAG TPA: tetratricopeptide repeat protein, partial [Trichormus sp.]
FRLLEPVFEESIINRYLLNSLAALFLACLTAPAALADEAENTTASTPEPKFYCRACEELQHGDSRHARKHLEAAARRGHAKSQTLVGKMYQEGLGVQKDLRKAEKWYQKAAKQGLKEAENELGHLYLSTEQSMHNPEKADKWLTAAAEHGVLEAQRDLGMLHLSGDLAHKDHDKAVRWLHLAADRGSDEAKTALAGLPGGTAVEEEAGKVQGYMAQRSQNVSQGMGNIEDSWEGYADLIKSMRSLTAN